MKFYGRRLRVWLDEDMVPPTRHTGGTVRGGRKAGRRIAHKQARTQGKLEAQHQLREFREISE